MPQLFTEPKRLHDVVKNLWHPAFCLAIVSITNNTVVKVKGDRLIGQLALWTGSAWKLLVAADSISATSKLAVIYTDDALQAGVASGGAIAKVPILERGPALVHKDMLDYAGQTPATVDAALLAVANIKVVDETGLALQWATP